MLGEMIRCDQCHKDTNDFYPPRQRGYKTTICWPCATKNMALWEKTHMVGKKVTDFPNLK